MPVSVPDFELPKHKGRSHPAQPSPALQKAGGGQDLTALALT